MSTARRATVYLDPALHRALRLKSAATDRSISDMINAALRLALAEDALDLEAFEKRRKEKSVEFEQFVQTLKRRGKL